MPLNVHGNVTVDRDVLQVMLDQLQGIRSTGCITANGVVEYCFQPQKDIANDRLPQHWEKLRRSVGQTLENHIGWLTEILHPEVSDVCPETRFQTGGQSQVQSTKSLGGSIGFCVARSANTTFRFQRYLIWNQRYRPGHSCLATVLRHPLTRLLDTQLSLGRVLVLQLDHLILRVLV